MKVKSEREVTQLCLTQQPHDCSLQALLSMGFSKQEYWSGVPLPSPMGQAVASKACKMTGPESDKSFEILIKARL